jgi:hypothetical protein
MRRMKLDTDRILSLAAMFIGVGSLATLAYQAGLTRQSQHASVLPYLYISILANDQQGVSLLLSNSGIGPAIVDDVRIHYQGRDIDADPYDFFIGLNDDNKKIDSGVDKVQRGRLIPAGTMIGMLQFAPTAAPGSPQKMLPEMLKLFDIAEVPRAWYAAFKPSELQHAVIEIVYSSVYGERWRVRSDRIVPERL